MISYTTKHRQLEFPATDRYI